MSVRQATSHDYWYTIIGSAQIGEQWIEMWGEDEYVTITEGGDLRKMLEGKYGLTFVEEMAVNGCTWLFRSAIGERVVVTVEDVYPAR
jgi:hypothetical protein